MRFGSSSSSSKKEKLFPLMKFQEFSTLLNSVKKEFGADRFFLCIPFV